MAKKVKLTAYQAAAKEFNELFEFDTPIDTTLSDEEIAPFLNEAITQITEDDEFTDETQAVIDELKKAAKKAKKEAPKAAPEKGKAKKQPEPEPEDDDDEDSDDDSDDEDEDEDEEPVKGKKPAPKATPAKGKAKKHEDDDEDEEPAPAEKAKKASDKQVKKSGADEPKKKGNFVAADYTRVDAVAEALLTGKCKSVNDWSDKADALLEKKGGKANSKENKFIIKYVQKFSKHFDFGVKVPME